MFFVFDLETTGIDPNTAHVVEWAMVPVDQARIRPPFSGLVRPPVPIPPETSAIHHIVDRDVEQMSDWSICSQSIPAIAWRLLGHDLLGEHVKPLALVAHNLDLERHFIGPLFPDVPWICTYRCALRIWPQAPAHNNETLRYWLGHGTGRSARQEPHSAAHDALVTAHTFVAMLSQPDVTLEQLLAWSAEDPVLPRCTIGSYRGMAWGDVPTDFLEWILYKAVDMRRDVYHSADLELRRRFKLEASA